MIDKIVKNRILIAAACYLAYATFFSYDGRRFLSSTKTGRPLEFVHITQTGGLTVEKAAADAKINWGACHYMKIDQAGCSEPDLEFQGGKEQNFMLHNIWHTPPKYLVQFDPDMNRNPYRGKDLFTLVRNPYTRLVSEFYSPYTGHEGDYHDEVWKLNEWITSSLERNSELMVEMRSKLDDGVPLMDIELAKGLTSKHFLPQVDYIYDDEGNKLIENLIHFENVEDEFSNLMELYGLELTFPHNREEEEGVLSYKDLYPKTIELINKFYYGDFIGLGYEMSETTFYTEDPYTLSVTKPACVKMNYGGEDDCEREKKKTQRSRPSLARVEVPIGATHSTTFLLGIYTDLSEEQKQARHRIRDTYLNVDDSRVCSLGKYIEQKRDLMIVPCRIPYVFIAGGAPDRPANHVDSEPLEVDSENVDGAPTDEEDIVYLNISENAGHGKSSAYLKWAASIGASLQIDFIAKAASSTLVDMALLMDFIDLDLPPTPYNRRSYGGSPWGFYWEGGYYATTPFYFMSIDIATFAGDKKIDWEKEEAHDIGRMIFKHPKPIKFINVNPRIFWFEELDTDEAWYQHWNEHMNELPRVKVNMENEKICQEFKEQGLLNQK